jgi:hypothetical protein
MMPESWRDRRPDVQSLVAIDVQNEEAGTDDPCP